jgi:hypothetical protein
MVMFMVMVVFMIFMVFMIRSDFLDVGGHLFNKEYLLDNIYFQFDTSTQREQNRDLL